MPGTGGTNTGRKKKKKKDSVLSLTLKSSRSNLGMERGFLSPAGSKYSVEKDCQPGWVWWPPTSDGFQGGRPRGEDCIFVLCVFDRPGLVGTLAILFQRALIYSSAFCSCPLIQQLHFHGGPCVKRVLHGLQPFEFDAGKTPLEMESSIATLSPYCAIKNILIQ